MSDSANPYESPRGVGESAPPKFSATNEFILCGHFIADENLLRVAARWLRTRHKVMLAIGVVLIHLVPAVMAIPAFFLEFESRGQSPLIPVLTYGSLFSPIALILIGALVYQVWLRANYNYQVERLGAGLWVLTVDSNILTLETPLGIQRWKLRTIRAGKGSYDPLILWLEPDLPIAIPSTGDFNVSGFDEVVLTIRRRLT